MGLDKEELVSDDGRVEMAGMKTRSVQNGGALYVI